MKKQIISEIIDQRLGSAEVGEQVSQFADDAACCETWRNYHLIGDVIRGEVNGGRCMIKRLQDALESEPTILAPKALGDRFTSANSPNAGEPQGVQGKVGFSSDAAKSAGLFAVAASLALVAVLTLSPTTPEGSARDAATIAGVEPGPDATKSGTVASDTAQQAMQAEFGEMLVEHGEFTATSGLNGLIAYTKLVTNQQIDE